jgi:aminoglycoside 3-N-acetyltransferase
LSDYSRDDLRKAVSLLPIEAGDTVFSHSNLGFFGRCEGCGNQDDLCEMFFDAVMERIGPDGTLVVPTFTYSYPKGEVYVRESTPSKMGVFAEWVRNHKDSSRSMDPCYSVSAIGKKSTYISDRFALNSFGKYSFFAKLEEHDGRILNFNFDSGSTFVHYVERKLEVPYRFDKRFSGKSELSGVLYSTDNVIWVRYLHDGLVTNFEAFDSLARMHGLFHTAKLGRGEMGVITAKATYDIISATLPKRPWFLCQAEVDGIIPDLDAIKANASAR